MSEIIQSRKMLHNRGEELSDTVHELILQIATYKLLDLAVTLRCVAVLCFVVPDRLRGNHHIFD